MEERTCIQLLRNPQQIPGDELFREILSEQLYGRDIGGDAENLYGFGIHRRMEILELILELGNVAVLDDCKKIIDFKLSKYSKSPDLSPKNSN